MARAVATSSRKGKPRAPTIAAPGWVFGLLCGAIIALAPALAIFAAALLAPGLAMHLIDRAPGKPAARAMLLFGACGCVGPVWSLWGGVTGAAPPIAAAFAVVSDPTTLAICWLAAGAGWLAHEAAPIIARTVLELAEAARIARLKTARAAYEAEWDLPPAGG